MLATGAIRRFCRVGLIVLASWATIAAIARPQASVYGEWDSPIDLGNWLDEPPPGFEEHADCTTGEIAHAVVLPPDDLANPETRVLFVCVAQYAGTTPAPGGGCDSNCAPNPDQIFGRSYL